MNRLIQQASLQVLAPIFDPQFSEASYGLCPGRRAQDEVKKARQYVPSPSRESLDGDGLRAIVNN
ncbi:hypothetical protein TcarDRAFT_2048 [Thermosinus carboxydivorans Nor1]|uniref:Uncharacterized protein n=1 Tax=Thermosinus carboxydivorans Nor1 TaxID=401526 RepID=A1HMU2_9FIRM|nr:hypothetical protein TcarDRAFT_2048 [Thermosinus carboxydivorans Nor1]